MFCHYSLRTTDIDAGREFYRQAIGLEVPQGVSETSSLEGWPLHERALARGAPAHWLGQIAVRNLDAVVERLAVLGSERLGPTVGGADGARWATVRDPFGAVIAIREGGSQLAGHPVSWHQLHTHAMEASMAMYCDLFGWVPTQAIAGPDPGGYQLFARREGGSPIGFMSNTARRAGVHAHWLYYFPVADMNACVTRVRSLGGTAIDPVEFAGTCQLAACEDPQGAAFGLIQRA